MYTLQVYVCVENIKTVISNELERVAQSVADPPWCNSTPKQKMTNPENGRTFLTNEAIFKSFWIKNV